MTKKHLQFLASLLNAARLGVAPENLTTMAAAYCAKDNPRFDEERFLSAAGYPANTAIAADGTLKVKRMYGLDNHAL